MTRFFERFAVVTALLMLWSADGRAQQPAAGAGESAELAKKLSNPISDLVSLPFQSNWEQNVAIVILLPRTRK